MMRFLSILALLAMPAAAWAGDDYGISGLMGLEPRQEIELDPPRQPEGRQDTPLLEYVITHSELETGFLYIDYGDDLQLESDAAYYARWRVKLDGGFDANLTLRYADFTNTDLPGPANEDVISVGGLAGAGYRMPVAEGLAVSVNGSVGVMRWESNFHGLSDETGILVSAEAAITAQLTDGFRLRLGGLVEQLFTDFHDADSETSVGLLVGIEIGG